MSDTKVSANASKRLVYALFAILLTIMIILWFWRPAEKITSNANQSAVDMIDIRNSDGNIQWKKKDGEWTNIISVQELKQGVANVSLATVQGEQGTKGDTGMTGPQGPRGNVGPAGSQGPQGAQGAKGDTGAQGLQGTPGKDGREVEIRKGASAIQWRYVGESYLNWRDIIQYSDLKGPQGEPGIQGPQGETGARGPKGEDGITGPAVSLTIGQVSRSTDCNPTAQITGQAPNQTLNLGLPGLPTGGQAGQFLVKKTNADCDYAWVSNPAGVSNVYNLGVIGAPNQQAARVWRGADTASSYNGSAIYIRRYMVVRDGIGFLHLDFQATQAGSAIPLSTIPPEAPTPKLLIESQTPSGAEVYVEPGSRSIMLNVPSDALNKRQIINLMGIF